MTGSSPEDPALEIEALRERLVRQGDDYLELEAAIRDLRERVEPQAARDREAAEHWKWQYEYVTTSRGWQLVLWVRRLRDRVVGGAR